MQIALTDSVQTDAAGRRRTADGYLVTTARVARTGIQVYSGEQVGRPDLPQVRVYRDASQVFADEAMRSYAHKPMTNKHPQGRLVSAETWKQDAIGTSGGNVIRDGEFVRVELALMDADAIADFEAGRRELSMGYTSELDFTPGRTADGQEYDAVQLNMRMNHIALVDSARGGPMLRFDHAEETPMTTRTIIVDGLQVEITDAGAAAVEKLQAQIRTLQDAATASAAAHTTALAERDKKLALADAEIEKLKAAQVTDAELDKRAEARATLLTQARTVYADGDYAGKSDADIVKMAVAHRIGDAAVAGKSADYLRARFDVLVGDAGAAGGSQSSGDAFRKSISDSGGAPRRITADAAYDARIARMHAGRDWRDPNDRAN